MKNNQPIFLLILLFQTAWLSAQQLTPSVLSSSGGFYSNDAGMLSFTTGEMVSIETYVSPAAILTQGFQQPWDLGTGVHDNSFNPYTLGVYPNPTNGNFNIVIKSAHDHPVSVRVMDVMGHEVLRNEFYHQSNIHVQPIDLSFAPPGTYLVYMHVQENVFVEKLQVIK